MAVVTREHIVLAVMLGLAVVTQPAMAQGMKNAEIADRLFLSPKTVRNHVSIILGKLQVADRSEAAIRAREAGVG